VILGLLPLVAALLPPELIGRVSRSWRLAPSIPIGELRVALAAVGLAMLSGIGLALFLG
jgi:hypothetical protein